MPVHPSDIESHFRELFRPLCQYAFLFCKDKEESKEIVQEVFIKIWEQRDQVQIQQLLKSYLYRAVKNQTLNRIRDGRKIRTTNEMPFQLPLEEDEPQHAFSDQEIHEAIQQLPNQCRLVFQMKRLEGLSYKEISQRLTLSEKTIENQMGIALKKLRAHLKLKID
ncbi:MAG: RNA polymerase sigma-70 factor [Cyclobacteriaceae bacterium]|nr:RNA polymerase sigma-70 factor [Cyclobacteriaceae bacterium]